MSRFRSKIPGGIARAVVIAFACFVPLGGHATSRDEDLFVRAEDMHTVLFGSLDAGRSLFLTTGVKRTLTGPLDRSGVVAMQSNGLGLTREHSALAPGSTVQRITSDGATLLGYQWALAGLYAALYAGPELHQEQLSVAASAGRWSKPRLGVRGQAELWANPTRDTLVTATLVAGTTRGSLWARVSTGLRLWRDLFVGPEAVIYMTDTYRETKVGGHITGLDVGILHMRVSAGIQIQDDRPSPSPYVALTGWVRL